MQYYVITKNNAIANTMKIANFFKLLELEVHYSVYTIHILGPNTIN